MDNRRSVNHLELDIARARTMAADESLLLRQPLRPLLDLSRRLAANGGEEEAAPDSGLAITHQQPLDFSSKASSAGQEEADRDQQSAMAMAAMVAVRNLNGKDGGGNIFDNPPPLPPPQLSPFNIGNLLSANSSGSVDPAENLNRLHRLIKANQALALASASASNRPPSTPTLLDNSPPQPPTELQRVNNESLQQFSHFRDQMRNQINLARMKRRRRSDSPTSVTLSGASEDEKSMVSSPGSPSSSLETSPEQLNKILSNNSNAKKIKKDETKDEAYWERRKKNNEAAKRSRDARRAKEEEVAIRAAFLEQENIQLKWEVATLKTEAARLKAMLLQDNSSSGHGSRPESRS